MILDKKDDAKIYYGKILEIDPPNILAHEQLIDLFINEDKFKYYLLRGNMHALQQQMSHAKNDFKKAIDHAKNPQESLPARYLYAGLCEGQGKLNEAVDEYLKISDYDAKDPVIYLKLAELLEKLAGKRGGQVVAGLLSNFDAAEKALREMEGAAGSADAEMSIVEESIDFKLNKLQQTWVDTIQNIVNRGDLGKVIDGLTKLSEVFGWIITKTGIVKPAIAAFIAVLNKDKSKQRFCPIWG